MKFNDLTGKSFENFVVIKRSEDHIQPNGRHRIRWLCKCNCGNEFITYSDFLNSKNRIPKGCIECSNKSKGINHRIDVVGKKYNNITILECLYEYHPTKVKCLCDCGTEFISTLSDVITGHTKSCGCLQRKRTSDSNTKDWTDIVSSYGIKFLKQDHMNKKGQWMWSCKCGLCENEFVALPAKIMNGHITSCGCASMSSGERFIKSVLDEMEINFVQQYTFNDCKNIYSLPFDFAIFDENNVLLFLIEYDGQQHFQSIEWFGGEDSFIKTQERDNIKTTYCTNNNIPLLRLRYDLSDDEIRNKIYEYHLSVTTAGCA